MSEVQSINKSPEQGALAKAIGLDAVGKAFGLESFKNVVPSLKKAMELANQNKDKSFFDKISIFVTSFTDEMDKLDVNKKQIAMDAEAKARKIVEEAKTAQVKAPDSNVAPISNPENSSEVDPNEPFVKDRDHFGNQVILRKSAMKAFKNAMKIADGKGIRLKVVSSYRDFETQARIRARNENKHVHDVGKWVSKAGHSNHHTGGTMDIAAMVQDSHGKWVGGTRHENQKLLWDILPKAGFVNYKPEPWHWEIYSERWLAAQKNVAGKTVYKKQATLNA